jgi:SAM-dependent methyltransferase
MSNDLKGLIEAPSLSRYLRISNELKTISLTRFLQYELIEKIDLKGSVLDFGGGDKALYKPLLKCKDYQSANIDKTILPTFLLQSSEPIPCNDKIFDTVISFNTLEHIYNAKAALEEMHRVLKKQGELLITTPFLFPVHGHPDDFFRPTSSWYIEALSKVGFTDIKVVPLFWGPLSTGQVCSGVPGPFRQIRKNIALLLDIIYFKFKLNRKKIIQYQQDDPICSTPLGYFISSIKR